jgi:arylformamidase
MIIHDVSQPLAPSTAAYPGDPVFRQRWAMRRADGDPVNLTEITMGVHNGTHVDGPGHTRDVEAPIGLEPLWRFLGPARVIHALGAAALDAGLLDDIDVSRTPRILLRSRRQVDPRTFPQAFAGLTPELARRLVDMGAVLVGTDAPSVDPAGASELEAHRILMEGGVAILENLVLDDVAEGEYTLVALPLRLTEADSSPVRAVLLEGERGAGADSGTGGLVEFWTRA